VDLAAAIRRRLLLLLLGSTLWVVSAMADVRDLGSQLQFSAAHTSWAVTMPRGDWVVAQEKRRADSAGFYYFVNSRNQALRFSMYLDKTTDCFSGETCRALFWRDPGPMFRDPKGVRQYERNGFHVVQFYLDGIAGISLKQVNVSAHMYRDGYWIHIRVSAVGEQLPDATPLIGFLDSISVK
jgi:hypothetical protein